MQSNISNTFRIIMDNIELTLVEARSSVQALGCKGRAKLERADSLTPVVSHVNRQFLGEEQ